MKTKAQVLPFKLKELDADGQFEGHGSVFDVVDSFGDVILPGAFSDTLKDHAKRGTMPALLWQHRADEPIGVYSVMREDDVGLFVQGQLLVRQNVPTADRAHSLLKAGAVSGLSIGFNIPKGGEEFSEEKNVYEISKVDLWETSIVTFPANRDAQITEVRNQAAQARARLLEQMDPDEFESFLRDAGFSRRLAKALMADGYAGISQRDARGCVDDATMTSAKSLLNQLTGH